MRSHGVGDSGSDAFCSVVQDGIRQNREVVGIVEEKNRETRRGNGGMKRENRMLDAAEEPFAGASAVGGLFPRAEANGLVNSTEKGVKESPGSRRGLCECLVININQLLVNLPFLKNLFEIFDSS